MEAPDKIYLDIQDLGIGGYIYTISLDNNGKQEYIRKGAVLDILENSKHLADAASKIDEL